MEGIWQKLKVRSLFMRMLIVDSIVGIIHILIPEMRWGSIVQIEETMKEGYSIPFLLLLFSLIMVLNSPSISARFVGGVIAPIMVLGAMLGASFGLTVQLLFPNHAVPVSVYMLVGVGAFIASAVELPVTAILLVLE